MGSIIQFKLVPGSLRLPDSSGFSLGEAFGARVAATQSISKPGETCWRSVASQSARKQRKKAQSSGVNRNDATRLCKLYTANTVKEAVRLMCFPCRYSVCSPSCSLHGPAACQAQQVSRHASQCCLHVVLEEPEDKPGSGGPAAVTGSHCFRPNINVHFGFYMGMFNGVEQDDDL